ncbi:putative tripeptidyl-peptidase II [Helianthus anomalus]
MINTSVRNESLGNYVAGMLVSWAFYRYDDKGHVIDVVYHDREVWWVALDTQSLEVRVGNLLNHGK